MANGYLIKPGTDPDTLKRRRRVAEALMEQASSTAPVGHWTQGLARVTGGALGGYMAARADDEERSEREKAGAQLKAALAGMQGISPDLVAAASNPYQSRAEQTVAGAMLQRAMPPTRSEQLSMDQLEETKRHHKVTEGQAARPIEVAPGATLVDPKTMQPSYTAPAKPTVQTPTAIKQKYEAENTIADPDDTIRALNRATELAPKAFSGFGSQAMGTAKHYLGQMLPEGWVRDKEGADATVEFGKMMSAEAIQSMAKTLAGATTTFEMQEFQRIIADPNVSPELKLKSIHRLLQKAETKRAIEAARIQELGGSKVENTADPGGQPRERQR